MHRLVERAEDVLRRKDFHGAGVQDDTEAAGVPKESAQTPDSCLTPGESDRRSALWESGDPLPRRRRPVGLNAGAGSSTGS
jgi:hypothetical protein